MPVEAREYAKEYEAKPFTTFLKEEVGYPKLKIVMTSLSAAVSSGKMAIKPREAKKVIERSEQVVSESSLARIQEKSQKLKQAYDQCLADTVTSKLVKELKETRQRGRANRTRQEELRIDLQRTIANEKRLREQVNLMLKDTEAFTSKLSETDLRLSLS